MTSHLKIFLLKQVTDLKYPCSAFLQRHKHSISCLEQLELPIYIMQVSKEFINFLNKYMIYLKF